MGDAIGEALDHIGITQDRVSEWLGDCGCEERKQKLNSLGIWAVRYLSGKRDGMKDFLDKLMGADSESSD